MPTSGDITRGVQNALSDVLRDSKVSASDVSCVTIGTTYFINALIEQDSSKLERVGVLRLASNDFTKLTPPFVDFPTNLRQLICGHIGFVNGGLNIDGAEIGRIQEEEIKEQCEILLSKAITKVVVVGVFSPIDYAHQQEQAVAKIIRQYVTNASVVCSSESMFFTV